MIRRKPVWWRVALALLIAGLLVAIPIALASASEIEALLPTGDLSEKHLCPNGYVALTFDDGPDPMTTPQITKELRDGGARGTFFFIGAKAEAYPDDVRLTRAKGMDVGNHTYDHPFLDTLTPDQVRQEMVRTSQVLSGLTNAPTLFRPPFGRTNPMITATAKSLGLTEVLWTYDSDDYDHVTVDHLLQETAKANNGAILLFHDGYAATVQAIPLILNNLYSRGLCSGRVVPSSAPVQAWKEYDGDDRTFYNATSVRW